MKVAIVTPYYKESAAQLRQCINSVREQSYPCTHILVADGHPNSGISLKGKTEHVVLPKSNRDAGNTPRGIGSVLADSWGYDAIAYLDADNWYDRDHIAHMVERQKETGCQLVACKRDFYTLDGKQMNYSEHLENTNQHVDTNCWLITRPAFPLFRTWFMPREIAWIGDRIFLMAARVNNFSIDYIDARSVAYRTAYALHYVECGLTPPPGSKPGLDYATVNRYLADPANHQHLASKLGFVPLV
ncbi:MAG: glycosyltransferase [Beijerinckiaceae bacterium]|nr:glycosyltransferase [Beijerinckiaceae bacterium]